MWNRSASTLVLATLLAAVPMAGAVLAQAPRINPKEKAMDKPADAKEVVMRMTKYTDLKVGEGDEAKTGQVVSVHYTGC